MNKEKQNPYAETDEEYSWRVNLGTVLRDSPRDAPIQFKLYGGTWTDRPIHSGNRSSKDDVVFYVDAEYRIKPPARRRIRKLSEIILYAEQKGFLEGSGGMLKIRVPDCGVFYAADVLNFVSKETERIYNDDERVAPNWFFEDVPEDLPK